MLYFHTNDIASALIATYIFLQYWVQVQLNIRLGNFIYTVINIYLHYKFKNNKEISVFNYSIL